MFKSLRSRWTISFSWRYWIPSRASLLLGGGERGEGRGEGESKEERRRINKRESVKIGLMIEEMSKI